MGLMDLIFGRRKASGDGIDGEINRQNKAYGDSREQDAEKRGQTPTDPRMERRTERMNNDLRRVTERARESHLLSDSMRKKLNKVDGAIENAGEANPGNRSARNAKVRSKLRGTYDKLQVEHEGYVEELRRKGAPDRQIREAETNMRKIRDEMSSLYGKAGGSGRLK